MAQKVLKADCHLADAYVSKTLTLGSAWYIQCDLGVPAATLTAIIADGDFNTADIVNITRTPSDEGFMLGNKLTTASLNSPTSVDTRLNPSIGFPSVVASDSLVRLVIHYNGTTITWTIDGLQVLTYPLTIAAGSHDIRFGGINALAITNEIYYVTNVKIGTTHGGTDLFQDDFSSGNTSAWTATSGSVSVVTDPFTLSTQTGRVLIAFDDGPLVPSPTWTRIDDPTGVTFPLGFVAGYDITSGRQTLLAQTDTGTATVYINDHERGLFDDRNASSPYFGKLDGKQILLQLQDPVTGLWESQFRGLIDDWSYDIDGSAVNASGQPINASIQIQCVDMFDYLAGYGLTPGLDGVVPPTGAEDSVYYAQTTGTVDDRIIEILTDVLVDESQYIVFSGNVSLQAAKYDPDESALTALRDACDAELPFIANMYVDRFGRFCFHGRYSRFDPDGVAADTTPDRWNFMRWAVGDGPAIVADANRAQMRVLSYSRSRSEIINVAIAYPANMPNNQMPSQVYVDATSITDYGKHSAPPMTDLLVEAGIFTGNDNYTETLLFAELTVKNQKDPRDAITALNIKTVASTDPRATTTWALLTQADISDIVNVKMGYPAGTGFSGASPADDYYIEGRQLTVRPETSGYDYVELDLEVSPAIWSMDTHSVFPARG